MSAAALPGDYHVHTRWSDGEGTVEECVRQAARVGLPELGIAEHVTPHPGPDEDWWLPPAQLGEYLRDVRSAAARHDDVRVLAGLELEYVAGQEAELERFVDGCDIDHVVLGIHMVDGFAFDDPVLRGDARWDDPDGLMLAYYRTVRRAARWGRFDVLAHMDYIGLWGHQPGPSVQPVIEEALDALAVCGAAIELNTDRVSDPAGVMYPSLPILQAARARGIPLTIDSDAHRAEDVGRFLDEAVALARRAGYEESLRLSDRSSVPLPPA